MAEAKVKKGNEYFYIYSDDRELDEKIAGLYSSSDDGMWPISAFAFEQWKTAIKQTLDDVNGGRGRNPVFENCSSLKLREILKQIKKENKSWRISEIPVVLLWMRYVNVAL